MVVIRAPIVGRDPEINEFAGQTIAVIVDVEHIVVGVPVAIQVHVVNALILGKRK